jgi:hypothetical protein
MRIIITRDKEYELTKQCSHVEDTYVGSKKCVECGHFIKAIYCFCEWKSVGADSCAVRYDIQDVECDYNEVIQ